jgi:Ca2+-binding EF-hand superfamily protein
MRIEMACTGTLLVLLGCFQVSETFVPGGAFPHFAASPLQRQCGVPRPSLGKPSSGSRAFSAGALRAASTDQEMRDEFSKLLSDSGRDRGMKKIEPPKGSVEWMQQQQDTKTAVQTAPVTAATPAPATEAAPEVVAPAKRPAYAVYDDGVGPQPAAKPDRPADAGGVEALPPALKSDIALTMFQTADEDGSGSLNFVEFEDLIHSVEPECSSETIQSLFESIVCNDDSCQESISFLGLYRWMSKTAGESGSLAQKLLRQNYENQAQLLFKEADTDGSGTVDAAELKVLGDVLGLKWTRKDAVEVCKQINKDGSGNVNFEEFFDWFCSQTGSSTRDKAGAFGSQLRLMLRAHGVEQRQVLITGFPFKATVEGAERFFERCGKINSIKMLPWAKTGKPSGRFLIEFLEAEGAQAALEMHKKKMGPRDIGVFRINVGDSEETMTMAR